MASGNTANGRIKTIFIGGCALETETINRGMSGRENDALAIACCGSEGLSLSRIHTLCLGERADSAEGALTSVLAFSGKIEKFLGRADFVIIAADIKDGFSCGAALAACRISFEKGLTTLALLPSSAKINRPVDALTRWIHGRIGTSASAPSGLATAACSVSSMLGDCLNEDCGGYTYGEIKEYLCPSIGFCCFSTGTGEGDRKAQNAVRTAVEGIPADVRSRTARVLGETVIAPGGSLNDLFVSENLMDSAFDGTDDRTFFSFPDEAAGKSLTVNILTVCR